MSPHTRALLIALAGPALSALGVLWVVVNVAIDTGRELTLRYVLFDPGHLVIVVGVAVSAICIPVALQVAVAEPEELELELFEPEPAKQEPGWQEDAEWGMTAAAIIPGVEGADPLLEPHSESR